MLQVWHSTLIPPEYRHNVDYDSPPQFDLGLLGFPKLENIKYGLKQSVVFYDRFKDNRYIDPLCRVIWQTVFVGSTPKQQLRSLSWKLDDGTWSEAHESSQPIRNPKVFLQKMRGRVIEELIDLAANFGLENQIKALYEKHSTEIYIYKESGSPKFKDAISNSKEGWLNLPSSKKGQTVRDVIMQYLSIGTVE